MSNRVFGRVWPLATSLGNRRRMQRPLQEAICNRDTGFAFPSTDTCNEVKNESLGYLIIRNTGAEANCKKRLLKAGNTYQFTRQVLLHVSKNSLQITWSFSQYYCPQATYCQISTTKSFTRSPFPFIAELVEEIRNIFESTSAQSYPLHKCLRQIHCLAAGLWSE